MTQNIVPVTAAILMGYIGLSHWDRQPDNLHGDKTQVIGSHPSSLATKTPNVISSVNDPYALRPVSGVQSQIPNPIQKAPLVNVPHTTGPTPYAVVSPDTDFHPSGTASHSSFKDIEKQSWELLSNRPASVPVSQQNLRLGKPMPMVDVRGRSQQYMAAAAVDLLASIPVTRPSGRSPMPNVTNMPAQYARAVKSYHYGTLLPGTKPAVYVHPESAHTSPSPWTRIYTGRQTKVTY